MTNHSQCATELLGFAVMFFIVFIAFAQLGYMIFGTENDDFRTFTDSIFTLMRTILGDFDYLKIEKTNRTLGPIYFILFIFFVFFVLFNMFLAIINDTYTEVKSETVKDVIHTGRFVRKIFNKILTKLHCRKRFVVEDSLENTEMNHVLRSDEEIEEQVLIRNSVDDRVISGMNERITILENSIVNILERFDSIIEQLDDK